MMTRRPRAVRSRTTESSARHVVGVLMYDNSIALIVVNLQITSNTSSQSTMRGPHFGAVCGSTIVSTSRSRFPAAYLLAFLVVDFE